MRRIDRERPAVGRDRRVELAAMQAQVARQVVQIGRRRLLGDALLDDRRSGGHVARLDMRLTKPHIGVDDARIERDDRLEMADRLGQPTLVLQTEREQIVAVDRPRVELQRGLERGDGGIELVLGAQRGSLAAGRARHRPGRPRSPSESSERPRPGCRRRESGRPRPSGRRCAHATPR